MIKTRPIQFQNLEVKTNKPTNIEPNQPNDIDSGENTAKVKTKIRTVVQQKSFFPKLPSYDINKDYKFTKSQFDNTAKLIINKAQNKYQDYKISYILSSIPTPSNSSKRL